MMSHSPVLRRRGSKLILRPDRFYRLKFNLSQAPWSHCGPKYYREIIQTMFRRLHPDGDALYGRRLSSELAV